MPYSNPILLAHLRTGRMAHTYLFSGPEGSPKNELVTGFARALNCEKKRFFEECDCLNCHKIEKRLHPDVHWLGEEEDARSIKIEEVRLLLHEATLKPFEGAWKVFILQGAERLTQEASNALLKTLEEPPEHSVFLLLVQTKAHLLETIQSRAFEIRVPPAAEKDLKEDPLIRLLEEKGWTAFFERLREAPRPKLEEELLRLLFHLRDRSASETAKSPVLSKRYLEAFDAVYETGEAVEANVNQKLALTHLEIQLGRLFND